MLGCYIDVIWVVCRIGLSFSPECLYNVELVCIFHRSAFSTHPFALCMFLRETYDTVVCFQVALTQTVRIQRFSMVVRGITRAIRGAVDRAVVIILRLRI